MSLVQLEGHEDTVLVQIIEPDAVSDTNVALDAVVEENPKSSETVQEDVSEAPQEGLPEYEDAGFLRPITAVALNDRYNAPCEMREAIDVEILPGAHGGTPAYLPPGWTLHVHPEGARYFVNADKKIVTDSDIEDSGVCEIIDKGLAHFNGLAQASGTSLADDREVYLRAVRDDDESYCQYYFVDHTQRTEGWVQKLGSSELGFERVTSEDNIKDALQEHYWTHVEFFPHRPIDKTVRQHVISKLRHGQTDQMTSSSSTFPYGSEDCERFIALLAVPDEEAANPFLTTALARLAGNMARVDFQIFSRQSHARLDRTQYRLYEPASAPSRLLSIASVLVLKRDVYLTRELEQCFPDRALIGMVWTRLMKRMVVDWTAEGVAGTLVHCATLGGVLPHAQPGGLTLYIALPTLIASCTAALSSGYLVFKYLHAKEDTATDGLATVLGLEHDTYGFQPVAIWWSAPRAFVAYSAGLFALTIVSLVVEAVFPGFVIPGIVVSSIVIGIILFLLKDLLSDKTREAWNRFKTWKEGSKLNLPEGSAV